MADDQQDYHPSSLIGWLAHPVTQAYNLSSHLVDAMGFGAKKTGGTAAQPAVGAGRSLITPAAAGGMRNARLQRADDVVNEAQGARARPLLLAENTQVPGAEKVPASEDYYAKNKPGMGMQRAVTESVVSTPTVTTPGITSTELKARQETLRDILEKNKDQFPQNR